MEIVPYREWCDVTPRGTPGSIGLPAPELWLHHGAQGQSTVATARAYARHHVHGNGWHTIGYSFLVAEGRVLEGRGPGRAGAHTSGRNGVSHGVCMVGDYSRRAPADRDIDALVWLLRHGHAQGWWDEPAFTGGHRDAPGASTTCPGNALHRMIPQINARPPDKDWFAMATEEDLRKVVREEIDRATGGRDIGQDLRALRLAVRGVLSRLGVTTRHDPPGAYDV